MLSSPITSLCMRAPKRHPFASFCGRDLVTPNVRLDQCALQYRTIENYKAEMMQRLAVSHELAHKALGAESQSRNEHFNKRSKDPLFRVGERVYLAIETKTPGLARKLSPKWKSPFRIVDMLSAVTCKVQ